MRLHKTLLLAPAFAFGLAGCLNITPDGPAPSVWRDDIKTPMDRHIGLNVNQTTHILHAKGKNLAAGEAERLGAFLASQGSPWSMDVIMQPLSSDGAATLGEVHQTLIQLGVQPQRISRATIGRRAGDGDIAVTARHIQASVSGCPDWRRSNLMDQSELNSSNFGCATADNLARMVADPRELATGRALAPASGAHAVGSVTRYRTDAVKPLLKQSGSGSAKGGGSDK